MAENPKPNNRRKRNPRGRPSSTNTAAPGAKNHERSRKKRSTSARRGEEKSAAGENRSPHSSQAGEQRNRGRTGPGGGRRGGPQRGRPRRGAGRGSGNLPPNVKRWFEVYDQYLKARRNYFTQYHKASDGRKKQLENDFARATQKLRDVEAKISPQKRQSFGPLMEKLPLDTTYSNNHKSEIELEREKRELESVEAANPVQQDFPDPHLGPEQKNRPSYADDTEESVGSYEDYKALKGLE